MRKNEVDEENVEGREKQIPRCARNDRFEHSMNYNLEFHILRIW
jgi:hypothetical protein